MLEMCCQAIEKVHYQARKEVKAFAVFYVENVNGHVPCVIRYDNTLGFPGGKVEEGEAEKEALFRECKEEGFLIDIEKCFQLCSEIREGKTIRWYCLSFNGKVAKQISPRIGESSVPTYEDFEIVLQSNVTLQKGLIDWLED
jgi:ADP-ribose pyrophosphatase YjhB (NUDIX family)